MSCGPQAAVVRRRPGSWLRIVPCRTRQVHAGGEFGQRAAGGDAAAIDEHERVGERQNLVQRVAGIDDGYAQGGADACEVGQDFGAPWLVEGGKRLVHEQQARLAEQGTADGHALALAA